MSLTADLCRILLISCALFGTVQAVEMKDGRVVLNLGFLYSGSGGFVSSGAFQDDVPVCVNNAATVNLQMERSIASCSITPVFTGTTGPLGKMEV